MIREKKDNVNQILLKKYFIGKYKEPKKVAIFDKIRKQGYGSLTREEKNLLFETDNNSTTRRIGYIDNNKVKDEKEKMLFQDYIIMGLCYLFFLIVLCFFCFSFILLRYYDIRPYCKHYNFVGCYMWCYILNIIKFHNILFIF